VGVNPTTASAIRRDQIPSEELAQDALGGGVVIGLSRLG